MSCDVGELIESLENEQSVQNCANMISISGSSVNENPYQLTLQQDKDGMVVVMTGEGIAAGRGSSLQKGKLCN